ncbi:hypothetical protein ACFZDK_21045 [Streptomyces sp. NPDC007901]|uniref:hypothetical protein n=1 Tax=Streptomyces sp. NPDC007901 TaxID=3364785 RepID=UPI0036EB7CEE
MRGVANGLLTRTENLPDDRTAYSYRSRSPIATELVQITVGGCGVRIDRAESRLVPRADMRAR